MADTDSYKPIVMPFSDLLKLLRIPFSVFLLPVFLFALIPVETPDWTNFTLLFFILHFLIYPASNAYNSYMDQDKGSIGGLEHPPEAGREVFIASIILDISALAIAFIISIKLMWLLSIYSVISRLYSWRKVRLKKYPIASWLVVSLIQGGFTFMTANMFFNNQLDFSWFTFQNMLGFTASSLLVSSFYPLTQIYQHHQDKENGDTTISYMLGIKGTFVFSALCFVTAMSVLYIFFREEGTRVPFVILALSLVPVILYFISWAMKSFKDPLEANFRNTMMMNKISSAMLIAAFILIRLLKDFA